MNKTKKIYIISLLAVTVFLVMIYYNRSVENTKEILEGTLVSLQRICVL